LEEEEEDPDPEPEATALVEEGPEEEEASLEGVPWAREK